MDALKVALLKDKFDIVVEEGVSLKKKDSQRQFIDELKVNVTMQIVG